ncbi:hypothetical protein MCOR27_009323 [Pyricularia oryzae]|nr:hypothetical protein MCOR27_009323 [Pyricularia oryzae]
MDRKDGTENGLTTSPQTELLLKYWTECQVFFLAQFRSLAALESLGARDGGLVNSPRICSTFFLSQLSTSNWQKLPIKWKHAFIQFALALHDLQRARRPLRACSSGSSVDFVKELENTAYSKWDPIDYPQALFMEVETKLGGLLDIHVFQLPFSRALRLDPAKINDIAADFNRCMRKDGIFLVQPEQIFSFKLMGLECLINGKESIGRTLLEGQQFFDENSCNIVDESDENFSVKFELVYTMETQRPIDYSPGRWRLVQDVMDVIRDVAPSIAQEVPASLEIHNQFGMGSFPRLRILKANGKQALVQEVASRICATSLSGLPIARQNEKSRAALLTYLTKVKFTPAEINAVKCAQ